MNDLDLLRQYFQQGSQEAFSVLVSRHLDLVYSAAKRQVGSPDLAGEVAQTVFLDLAANAHKIPPSTHLASWLFVASRRRAIDLVRREASRQRREQTAVEVSAMKDPSLAWQELEPLLDEAIASLNDNDRQAILLRFFENRSLEEVGRALGSNEDAAQKRVGRAVEKLRSYLARRGLVTAAAVLAADLSAYAVQTAPTGLGHAIVSTVAVNGAAGGAILAHQVGRSVLSTVWSKVAVSVAMASLCFVAYEKYQLRREQQAIDQLKMQVNQLRETSNRLKTERDQARERTKPADAAYTSADAEFDARVKQVLARIAQIKKRFSQDPHQEIPEMGLLSESDWFGVVQEQSKWDNEDDIQEVMSSVRTRAKNRILTQMQQALNKYIVVSHGQLPSDVMQLAPYFPQPVDAAILVRYEMQKTGLATAVRRDEVVIQEKAALVINPRYDNFGEVFLNSTGVVHVLTQGTVPPELKAVTDAAKEAYGRYSDAHDGDEPDPNQPEQLLPYFANPEQGKRYVQIYTAAMNPLQFSRPNAMGEATYLYRVAHHGTSWTGAPEELAPYFQNPDDAAKFLNAVKDGTISFR